MDILTEMVEIELDEDELANSVNDLKKLSIISIERKNENMGLKIHQSIKSETHEFLKNKDNDEFIEISWNYFESLMNILITLEKREGVNKWSKQNYYFNFKLIFENSLRNLENDEKVKFIIYERFANFLYCLNMYFDEAIKYFIKSLEINKKIVGTDNDLNEPKILTNIGIIYHTIGQYDESLKYLNESLKIKGKYLEPILILILQLYLVISAKITDINVITQML